MSAESKQLYDEIIDALVAKHGSTVVDDAGMATVDIYDAAARAACLLGLFLEQACERTKMLEQTQPVSPSTARQYRAFCDVASREANTMRGMVEMILGHRAVVRKNHGDTGERGRLP